MLIKSREMINQCLRFTYYIHALRSIHLHSPCQKCDTDFLMPFWRQFGRKWHQIRWKSHHFLGWCHGNSMALELVQNPSHVPAWRTNKTWINDMESSWNLVSIWTKLRSICNIKWHGISMRIHVTFWTGHIYCCVKIEDVQKMYRRYREAI